MRFFNSSITKKYRGKQKVKHATGKAGDKSKVKPTSDNSGDEDEDDVTIEKHEFEPEYEDYDLIDYIPPSDDNGKVRYTGKAQVPNKIVTYVKEQCPINGLPAAHVEFRIIRHQALNRIGIYSVSDIEKFNIEKFLYPRLLLKGTDDRTLARIGKITTGETSTRNTHSAKYRNRRSDLPFISNLSSYKDIGHEFCRGSIHEYHGELYIDVQDVLDRLSRYGGMTKDIRKYFPDYDVSIFNL